MKARGLLRLVGFFLEAILIAFASGVVGLVLGDLAVEGGIVECDELECLEPPLIGGAFALILGLVLGSVIVIRSRDRTLFRNAGWAIVLAGGAVYLIYAANS